MSTRILTLAAVLSVVLTVVSVLGEETPRRIGVPVMIQLAEHEPAGGHDEVERPELKERIRHLLAEAEGIEARAAQLRAEARELEHALAGGHEDRDEAMRARQMREKLAAMKEIAGRFERDGHHEVAREIGEKAEILARELEQRGARMEREPRGEGDAEWVGNLWARIEGIRETLGKGDQDRGERERVETLERELAELNDAAERASHAGREGEARELRMEIERVGQELESHHKHARRAELREVEEHRGHAEREAEEAEREHREVAQHMENMHRELEELTEAAERAEREGRHEEARELHGRAMEVAESIRMHGREMRERQMHEARERGDAERVGDLEREAEEIRRMLQRERGNGETDGHMEGMYREFEDLRRAAERAEREGHPDRARDLRRRTMEAQERIRQHEREMEERHMHEAEQRLEDLEHGARQAREEGRHDEAERMMAEAEEIERRLHAAREGRRMGEQLGRLHGVIEALQESYRHAVDEGRFDRAEGLRALVDRMADMAAGHLSEDSVERDEPMEHDPEKMPGFGSGEISVVIRPSGGGAHEGEADVASMHVAHDEKAWDVGERIEQLRARARDAEEAGKHDEARAISEEAQGLERFLRTMWEPKDDEAAPPQTFREEEDEVGVLRRDVEHLRRDLQQLTDAIRRKIGDF